MKVSLVATLLPVSLPALLAAQSGSLRITPRYTPLLAPHASPMLGLDQSDAVALRLRPALRRSSGYRWELEIAGAALLGSTGVVAANAACTPDTTSENCIGPVVGTAAARALVGGVVGLFVGAGIERRA